MLLKSADYFAFKWEVLYVAQSCTFAENPRKFELVFSSAMVAININKLYDFAKFRDCFSIKRTEGDESFQLTVQNKCLKSWYDLKKRSPDVSYVQIINGFLAKSYVVLVKERCARIENRVRSLANLTNTKLSTKRGRAYMFCEYLVIAQAEFKQVAAACFAGSNVANFWR